MDATTVKGRVPRCTAILEEDRCILYPNRCTWIPPDGDKPSRCRVRPEYLTKYLKYKHKYLSLKNRQNVILLDGGRGKKKTCIDVSKLSTKGKHLLDSNGINAVSGCGKLTKDEFIELLGPDDVPVFLDGGVDTGRRKLASTFQN